jgi:glycosyltransferase involved in cell wall biosynthesis
MKKKNKKRLMILIWDMDIGGVQKRVRDIVIDIGKNYPDVHVYLAVKRKTKSYHLQEIKKAASANINYFNFTGSFEKSKSIYALVWIIRSYLKIKPDITLTFLDHLSIIMVFIKKIIFWHKTKLVLNEGILTSDYLNIYRRKVWLWKFLVKLSYKHADKIIVPSRAVKKDLVNNFSVPKEKLVVINNWTLLEPRRDAKKRFDLIFIGRFEKEKDPLAVINIVKKLKVQKANIKLAMLGKGKMEKIMRKTISNYNLEKNIEIIGFKSNVIPYLKQSKIHVLTTINEGMPNVVLEAAICQIPTISSNFPGAKEVIKHSKTGFLCHSQKEMVDCISKVLKSSELRKRLGNNAQSKVLKYHSRPNQRKFISVLINSELDEKQSSQDLHENA